ncbi:peptide chain release factor N(5)-glutamine methyltransferase [Candidatus Dojkabacteria bacterium]|nr:peptide chain release factor N(5)-glutamine methyltransferase [Candidatus Dojkabacteria bacterium]
MTKRRNKKISEMELEILTSFILGKPKEFSIANPDFVLSKLEKKKLSELIKRRLSQEPLAYILGKKEFFGLDFKVNKNVLIPRPETEHLVEEAVKAIIGIRDNQPDRVIKIHELATGSGAIIVSLAHELVSRRYEKNLEFEASDISEEAMKVARENAKKLLKENNHILFRQIDILKTEINISADILISNPPYIPSTKIAQLDKTIRNFEPWLALDGGNDGLEYYHAIFGHIQRTRPGIVLLEIESTNTEKIRKTAKDTLKNYSVDTIKDLAGKDRILKLNYLPFPQ